MEFQLWPCFARSRRRDAPSPVYDPRDTMRLQRLLVLLAFAVVLGVPFAFRPEQARTPAGAERLVIITPHGDQIRWEFANAFDRWHRDRFGAPVVIDWRVPGGTSEIRKQLIAIYTRAVRDGQITPDGTIAFGALPFDLFFGGGSYEHTLMKRGVKALPPGAKQEITIPISTPAGFTQQKLDEWFGENAVGSGLLYDPEQFWLGSALSGFGIAFNRDALRRLGLPDPTGWKDLTDPRYQGWLGLADPRASGSVLTTFESIINIYDWDEGWRILRDMGANARSFANSSPKVPLDVGAGEVAAGLSIDYYGRYESQSLMRPGETPDTARVGYIDPPGEVFIDADPITLLRGGPNPVVARRFIEFVLSEEGQALWNFPARSAASAASPPQAAGPRPQAALGPDRFEVRRMPVRRVMFEKYADRMIDKANPFEIASKTKSRGWRDAIGLLMASFSIEIHPEQAAAWRALNAARAAGRPDLAELESLFYALPAHRLRVRNSDGATEVRELPLNKDNYKAIAADWAEARKTGRLDSIRVEYMAFFRKNYEELIARAVAPPRSPAPADGRGPG